MKKLGLTLLTAFVGGAMALGAYKLVEAKYNDNLSFEDKQKVYFANNPLTSNVTSSAGEVDFTQAAAVVTPAVVYIRTTYAASGSGRDPMDMFDQLFGQRFQRGQRQRAPQASGSGVIISPDGYIVTNNHVVDKAEKISVTTNDHRVLEAKVIGRDPNTDLALIKVNASNLPIVKLGNSDDVRVGEWVLAVGNPFNLTSTVTAGIVSAKGRGIGIIGTQNNDDDNFSPYSPSRNAPAQPKPNSGIESFIQTDAAINPGNSGGALVNTKGELIGINAAIASHTGSYEGYGFAIPVNLAKKVLNDIKQYGSVKRGYLGVTYVDLSNSDQAEIVGVKDRTIGLYVDKVVPSSGAEAAGIKSGDIITKVDGNLVTESSDLTEHIGRMQPGDKVKITVSRDNKDQTFTVTLKGDAGILTNDIAGNHKAIFDKMGATFRPLTQAQRDQHHVKSGLLVTGVRQGGMFDELGVATGSIITSVNKAPVNSIEDINKALDNSTRRGILVLSGINPDGSTFSNAFQLQ